MHVAHVHEMHLHCRAQLLMIANSAVRSMCTCQLIWLTSIACVGCDEMIASYTFLSHGTTLLQVAHAWIQGQTSLDGAAQEDNTVSTTLAIVARCAESIQPATHLAVIRALLTIVSAEHFVPHGEALVECIKIIVNLAIGTDDRTVGLTAQNALLQVRGSGAHLSCFLSWLSNSIARDGLTSSIVLAPTCSCVL